MIAVETGATQRSTSLKSENTEVIADSESAESATFSASDSANPRTEDDSFRGDEDSGLGSSLNRSAESTSPYQPLADGSFSSVGPDSAVFNRFDQPTLVGLLLFCSLCIIGWSTWQWLTLRTRTIDIDEGRRTQLRFEVDLNRAPAAEFANLPGVGPKLAEEIVTHRQQIGRFSRFEDLLNVSGIGEAKFKAILPFLRPIEPAPAQPKAR
ncbi:MAG: ComEA family DNA-binding protein [Planctomycetota bacterium]